MADNPVFSWHIFGVSHSNCERLASEAGSEEHKMRIKLFSELSYNDAMALLRRVETAINDAIDNDDLPELHMFEYDSEGAEMMESALAGLPVVFIEYDEEKDVAIFKGNMIIEVEA